MLTAPFVEQAASFLGQIGVVAKLVQQYAMVLFLEQTLVLMLTMDIDQKLAEFTQQRQWCRAAVDVASAATFSGYHSAQMALLRISFEVMLAEPESCLGDLANIKTGCQLGSLCTCQNAVTVGSVAQAEPECIKHDRFACAGFTADDGHPPIQFDFKIIDDGKIANGQLSQHDNHTWLFIQYLLYKPFVDRLQSLA